jgi:hypothetical protein
VALFLPLSIYKIINEILALQLTSYPAQKDFKKAKACIPALAKILRNSWFTVGLPTPLEAGVLPLSHEGSWEE